MSLICYYFGIQQWGKNFRAPRSVQNIQRLFCYSCIFYQKQLFQLLLLNNKLPPNLATWINHFILTEILESHQEFEEGVFPQSSSANGVWLLLGVHAGLSHLKTPRAGNPRRLSHVAGMWCWLQAEISTMEVSG